MSNSKKLLICPQIYCYSSLKTAEVRVEKMGQEMCTHLKWKRDAVTRRIRTQETQARGKQTVITNPQWPWEWERGGKEMDRASAAVQQKRKSNHFLITMLPRLVGLIWRKRIMFFDLSPWGPVNFRLSTRHPLECSRLPLVLPDHVWSVYKIR